VRQDSLTKHVKYIHEGKEKPYKCSYLNCSTGTYTQAKLDTHIRRKHVEGRHHYQDERTSEWKQNLDKINIPDHANIDHNATDLIEIDDPPEFDTPNNNNVFLDENPDDTDLVCPLKEQIFNVTEQITEEYVEDIKYHHDPKDLNENAESNEQKIIETWIISQNKNFEDITDEKTLEINNIMKPFKCTMCEYSGAKKRYLKKHMLAIHNNKISSLYTSNEYVEKYADHEQGKDTFKTEGSLKCDLCDYLTDEKYLLSRHVKNVHSEIKAFVCAKCDFKTTYKYGLKKHEKVVHNDYKPHKCTYPSCSFKGTANKANLDIHIRAVHLKIKDHVCDICGYATVDKHTLLSHKKGVHDGIKDLICSTCGYVTSYAKALQRHIKVVHETKKLEPHEISKDFICASCGFGTHNQKNLNDHIKRRHESQDDKVCATCGFTTNTQANLNAHMRRKHEDEFAEPVKTISCDKCVYVTNRISCLKQHKKASHERIKDKICVECGFETSYAGSLKNHINEVHASEKINVKCTLCSYSTNRTRNLKTHVMTVHYKLKPKPRNKCKKNTSTISIVASTVNEINILSNNDDCITWQESTA
jgi:hypothetical protein